MNPSPSLTQCLSPSLPTASAPLPPSVPLLPQPIHLTASFSSSPFLPPTSIPPSFSTDGAAAVNRRFPRVALAMGVPCCRG
ncbi:unnamed protein product [Closterium sp. NIES-54]